MQNSKLYKLISFIPLTVFSLVGYFFGYAVYPRTDIYPPLMSGRVEVVRSVDYSYLIIGICVGLLFFFILQYIEYIKAYSKLPSDETKYSKIAFLLLAIFLFIGYILLPLLLDDNTFSFMGIFFGIFLFILFQIVNLVHNKYKRIRFNNENSIKNTTPSMLQLILMTTSVGIVMLASYYLETYIIGILLFIFFLIIIFPYNQSENLILVSTEHKNSHSALVVAVIGLLGLIIPVSVVVFSTITDSGGSDDSGIVLFTFAFCLLLFLVLESVAIVMAIAQRFIRKGQYISR